MFITNQLTPAEMLSELVSVKGYTKGETERFKRLRHNADLCPGYRERASAMLDAYIRVTEPTCTTLRALVITVSMYC
jgi:hypothetical protein